MHFCTEPYFSVLPFRGWVRCLFGLLLTALLACAPAEAQEDRPLLRLLVLGANDSPVRAAKSAGVDDTAVPALASRRARSVTAAFLGRPIDDALLGDIRDQLATYYSSISRPFVDIAIPAQDVAGGVLRVNIIETKRGRVTVEGNRWFDAKQYTDAIRAPPGGPIDIQSLTGDTEWLNRGADRHATISLRPTDEPAIYDIAINAKDDFPLEVTLAADNTGTRDTGLYRTAIGVDWTNAFWRGDDLGYGFLASPDGFRLVQHAVSYTTYLPWRDTMSLFAAAVVTRGTTAGSANGSSINGRADIVSWRYALALPSTPDFVQHIYFGYDFKSTNTNILNGGALIFPTTSELDQFPLSYETRRNDSQGWTALAMILVGSPGHLTPRNTEAALADQQPGASPSYLYGRISIERLTALPHDATWSARLTGQLSSDNLLSSEQLVLGGAQSIRGFVELAATRDSGAVMQQELRFPPISPSVLPGLSEAGPVVPFGFLDAGVGRNHLDLADVRRSWVEMVSVGPGLTWQFVPSAALRFSWGFPLVHNGHFGSFLGPQFGTQITF
jgi:hemolysin activation/secretion protein